jgi:squalene cyclase
MEHFIKKGSMISSFGNDNPQADTRSIPDCDRTSNLQNQTYSCQSPAEVTAITQVVTAATELNRDDGDDTIDVDENDSIVMDDNDYSVLDDNSDIEEVDN